MSETASRVMSLACSRNKSEITKGKILSPVNLSKRFLLSVYEEQNLFHDSDEIERNKTRFFKPALLNFLKLKIKK